MGIGSIGGSYLNFIVGTGSEEVGKVIKSTIKNRKANNQSYIKALYKGTKDGIVASHNAQKAAGGYFKSLANGFKAIPNGWKSGKGLGKLTGALKGCGKAMPALFAGLALLAEVPNVVKAVKEKGIVQGLKETGKTAVRLTFGALGGALGSLIPIPVVGTMIGWCVGEWIGSKIVGKSYTEIAEANKTNQQNEINQNPNTSTNINDVYVPNDSVSYANGIGNVTGSSSLPPIEADFYGPYGPYGRIFYKNPMMQSGMNMGLGAGMGMMPGMFPMMGGGVNLPNTNGNLLANNNPSGNLLNAKGAQNLYANRAQVNTGSLLNINR